MPKKFLLLGGLVIFTASFVYLFFLNNHLKVEAQTAPTFTVTSPIGNVTWNRGTNYQITWDSVGAGSSVFDEVRLVNNDFPGISYRIGLNISIVSGQFSYTVSPGWFSPPGNYHLRFQYGFSSIDDSAVINIPAQATTKTITVNEPASANSWLAGSSHDIVWSVNNMASGMTAHINLVTPTGGTVTGVSVLVSDISADLGRQSITLPTTIAPGQYRIKVETDEANVSVRTRGYSSIFNVNVAPATITSPVRNEIVSANQLYTVRWAPADPTGGKIYLQLRQMAGGVFNGTWQMLVGNTPNDGEETIVLPYTNGDFQIRLLTTSSTIIDSEIFSISTSGMSPPFMELYKPFEYQTLIPGQSFDVNWRTMSVGSQNDGLYINWKLGLVDADDFTLRHGRTPNAIPFVHVFPNISLASFYSIDGSATVNIPTSLPNGNYRVALSALAPSSGNNFVTTSNGILTVNSPYNLTVDSPAAGANWPVGSPQTISWSGNLPAGESFKIERLDTADQVVGSAIAPAGARSYSFTVPADAVLGQYKYRVNGENYTSLKGESGLFNIVAKPPLSIVSSNPVDGAIDARQPHPVTSVTPAQGWNSVALTFSDDPSSVTAADFAVLSTTTSGFISVPAIASVAPGAANSLVVNLDRPIPPGALTSIIYKPSGAKICLGFLPGDVNASRAANAQDVLALTNFFNSTTTRSADLWKKDIDRSGNFNAQDMTALTNLLNGAGAYDQWLNKTLPPFSSCPTAGMPGGGPSGYLGGNIGPVADDSVGTDRLSGWAWSGNMGWIYFGSTTTPNTTSATTTSATWFNRFGVKLKALNNGYRDLNGFAWSPHIGWINFSPGGPYPEDGGDTISTRPAAASLRYNSQAKSYLHGWARACAVFYRGCSDEQYLRPTIDRGNWDGWIALSGQTSPYGDDQPFGVWTTDNPIANDGGNYNKFVGYAWGADNVGWISFCDTIDDRGIDNGVVDQDFSYCVCLGDSCNQVPEEKYKLTLIVGSNGSAVAKVQGSNPLNLAEITCSSDTCSSADDYYPAGTNLEISATTHSGYKIDKWIGDCTPDSNDNAICLIDYMNSDKTVTVSFEPITVNTHQLTVVKISNNGGSGKVTSNPAGINCGSDCSEDYFDDISSVTLTAATDAGSTFGGWSGDAAFCGLDSSCTISMNADKNVTAKFDKDNSNLPEVSFRVNPLAGTSFDTYSYSYPLTIINDSSNAEDFCVRSIVSKKTGSNYDKRIEDIMKEAAGNDDTLASPYYPKCHFSGNSTDNDVYCWESYPNSNSNNQYRKVDISGSGGRKQLSLVFLRPYSQAVKENSPYKITIDVCRERGTSNNGNIKERDFIFSPNSTCQGYCP